MKRECTNIIINGRKYNNCTNIQLGKDRTDSLSFVCEEGIEIIAINCQNILIENIPIVDD